MSAKPTIAQIRQLHRENATWPLELKQVPSSEWDQSQIAAAFPESEGGSFVLEHWRSRHFQCTVWNQGSATRLSINRTDYDLNTRHPRADITWDDLQRLKSEAGYGHLTAVEIYPPDKRVVNVANMRHLFIVDAPEFMW